MKPFHFGWLITVVGAFVSISSVQAGYPERILHWIVTMPPGGGNDAVARPVARRLSEALGQQVVVDNRGGAGGNIGAAIAAKSPPDGYTLVMLGATHAMGASLYTKLNYDLVRDFAPVTLLAASPGVLVVHPTLPVKSVKELIALANAKPGQITYSSSGNGSPNHLQAGLFSYMTGVKMVHVPYKGGGPGMIGLIGGEVSLSFASMPASIAGIRSGKLRAIAVSTAQRSPSMPSLPTISEAGVPGYEATIWYGLAVPAGVPKEIISRLHAETLKVLNLPDVIQQLDNAGLQVRTSTTPEQYAAFMQSEVEKWAKVVKAADLHLD